MSKTKVLFAAFEATPFIKTGGLGDVAGSLPAYIKNEEFDVRVILPKLSSIPAEYTERMKFVESYEVPLGWRSVYCGLFTLRRGGVTYYFLDNEYYFKRDNVYGEFDDGERVAFFSKAVCETIGHIAKNFMPDILHCNDWHTAMVPVFLREQYNGAGDGRVGGKIADYGNIKTVFTIHNLKFQGQYDPWVLGDVCGLHGTPAEGQLMHDKAANYLQGAVIYSDAVTTVSPTYAEEICTPEYGEGLDGLFRSRKYKLSGIVNGIDYKDIDPETDKRIGAHFSANELAGKAACKAALQRELGFIEDPDVPLFVMISRLTVQKGANLVRDFASEITSAEGIRRMQLAVLGTGDAAFEEAFRGIASGRKQDLAEGEFAAEVRFSEPLSRRMYAGADAFLMPSQFEPCGLSQMMAMRYGCLPVVRETGGLKDTVKGYWNVGADEATGFSFRDFDIGGLRSAVDCALDVWYNKHDEWLVMQQNTMAEDNSWDASAEKYRELYRALTD